MNFILLLFSPNIVSKLLAALVGGALLWFSIVLIYQLSLKLLLSYKVILILVKISK